MTRDPSGDQPATWVALEPKKVDATPAPALARHHEHIETSLVPAHVGDLPPVRRETGKGLGPWIGGEPVGRPAFDSHRPEVVLGHEHDLVAIDRGMAVVTANCQGQPPRGSTILGGGGHRAPAR